MLIHRPRRNRKSRAIRALVQETRLSPQDLIYPLFVKEGKNEREPIASLPGICRLTLDQLLKEVEKAITLGIPAIALFPVISSSLKDDIGSEALNPKGILPRAIAAVKKEFPPLCIISDVALDPYSSQGHDGLVDARGEVINDETVELLVKMALIQAEAGVDMVAPSDMMDGRVRAIREGLDRAGFSHVNIHAYTAKYASAFYGPFRDALGSRLKFGDKKSYQMNPANQREALLEALLDQEEGADIIMVKPALPYLDVIAKLRAAIPLPLSAYQVSGEYAMLKAAEKNGWLDGKRALLESVISIKRAGADMIFTYGACEITQELKSGTLD